MASGCEHEFQSGGSNPEGIAEVETCLNPCSASIVLIPTEKKNVIMSSVSTSNFQSITDALADYAKITGIDLSKNPFTATLEQSNSPEAILRLLQARAKTFKEYRDGSQRLISSLSPAVKVLQAFSGILGEAVSLVSRTYYQL